MQALGTVAGYIAGLVLISVGVDHGLVWRILLGLGAVPSALVLYARLRMPESPRYLAWVKGDGRGAADGVRRFSAGKVDATGTARAAERISLRQFLSDRRLMLTLLRTAGTWFVFDYAYYGNAVSAPSAGAFDPPSAVRPRPPCVIWPGLLHRSCLTT